jgi:shikimate dehydrogenase
LWRYLTIEVYPEDLAAAMQGLRAFNMRGVNLTIPHKIAVLKYLDEISAAAQLIGAVNTVVRQGDRLVGENTDGKGFMQSLRLDAGIDPSGMRVVVLGAGGAARAITVELALAGAAQITVVNRQPARGHALVDLLNEKTPVKAGFVPWERTFELPEGIDVLVNATSIGLFPNVDDKPDLDYATIQPGMTVCDVIPILHNPIFYQAHAWGAHPDGLGMLVYQGAII